MPQNCLDNFPGKDTAVKVHHAHFNRNLHNFNRNESVTLFIWVIQAFGNCLSVNELTTSRNKITLRQVTILTWTFQKEHFELQALLHLFSINCDENIIIINITGKHHLFLFPFPMFTQKYMTMIILNTHFTLHFLCLLLIYVDLASVLHFTKHYQSLYFSIHTYVLSRSIIKHLNSVNVKIIQNISISVIKTYHLCAISSINSDS